LKYKAKTREKLHCSIK